MKFLFLTIMLSTAWATAIAQSKENPVFQFGVFTDVQYADIEQVGERDYRGVPPKLEKTIEILNQYDLEFTVNIGDLIDQDFKSFELPLSLLEKSKAKVYHVFGNHDFTIQDEKKKMVPTLLGNSVGYHAFEKEHMKFILLNGLDNSLDGHAEGTKGYAKAKQTLRELEEAGGNNAKPWNGGLGEKQFDWLAAQLKQAEETNKQTLIFCHYPLLPENGLQLWNNREVLELIRQYPGVVAWFSGHHHAGNYVIQDGVHHLTFLGMVESKEEALGAVIQVFEDGLAIKGFGEEEDKYLPFRP
ncbi:metallophosphoesterase [Pleomorphovibrio marinus]|uniref:metallophosphoesterase n=1 Tax=Pleomorphovibrio marinus TaxID=2164132 RepID=UPI000E0AC7FA|nr:metallophosphoesterase [Pleomorphovibrio marinus]